MVFSKEDRIWIHEMRIAKGYGAKLMLKEFPHKNWSLAGVKRLLKNIADTESSARKVRPMSRRTPEIIAAVEEMILSQESQPGTHRSLNEIAREIKVSRSTVRNIVHNDLNLKCLKKKRAQQLTEANQLTRLVRAKQPLRDYPQIKVTSYGTQMKNFLQLLHQRMRKTIDGTCREVLRSNKFLQHVCCRCAQHSQKSVMVSV